MRDELTPETRIQCALDRASGRCTATTRRRSSIDDRVAFVGGIDLTYESGDRVDPSEHPARAAVGWHDAAARIEGPGSSRRG